MLPRLGSLVPGPMLPITQRWRPSEKHFGGFARQFAGDLVDLEGAFGEVEFAQRDRRGAEGVGLHHVGAGLEIAAVDFAHQVGARQHQNVGAVLAAPVVLLDIQRQRLDAAAHAAVAQQHVVAQGIEQMGTGHRVAFSARVRAWSRRWLRAVAGGGPDADRQRTREWSLDRAGRSRPR